METFDLEIQARALKASRNIHRDFMRYLTGKITFKEFGAICQQREADFKTMNKRGVK